MTSTRYVGWSVCHEEVAEEIFKLIKVSLGLIYKKNLENISFQRPTFLHPEAALPDHPWVFIGFWVKINNFAFPLKAPRVPVPTFMWTMLIYQAGRWGSRESETQVSFGKSKYCSLVTKITPVTPGTAEGCEDLEAPTPSWVLDVLSWRDADHCLSWGYHHHRH